MRFIEKVGSIEHIYEADTPEEIINLYNKKNSKIKFNIVGENWGRNNLSIDELENELNKVGINDLKIDIQCKNYNELTNIINSLKNVDLDKVAF